MARKPKTQPSTEAAAAVPVPELATAPARRGRKPKAPSPALPLMVRDDDPATDAAEAGASEAGPTNAPGRRGPGRKPKQRAGAEAATLPQDTAVEQAGAMANPSAAGLGQLPAEDDAAVAERVVPLREAAAGDAGHGGAPAGTAAPSAVPAAIGVVAASRTVSAARWDRATDAVRFDWPGIERIASAAGPNQGMAKLLVAARAEGASSRWAL
jgi:hypothetical protein